MDTCAMTSTSRECCLPRPALDVRFVLPMVAEACDRAYRNADMDPNSNPDRTEESESETERARIERDFAQARQVGWAYGHEKTQARKAAPMAITPPRSPSETLSISNSRAMRMRSAPNPARMESSWWRDSARANRRLATSVHNQHDKSDGRHDHPRHTTYAADDLLSQRKEAGEFAISRKHADSCLGIRPGIHPYRSQ